MPGAAQLLEPSAFEAFSDVEVNLRRSYLQFGSPPQVSSVAQADPEVVLQLSAHFLEVFLVSAATFEVLNQVGAPDIRSSGQPMQYFRARVKELTGLDPSRVADEAVRYLGVPASSSTAARVTLPGMLGAARGLLEVCPIEALEYSAYQHGLESWGHRCRLAYDAIRSFVIRNDPSEHNRLKVLGREYLEGNRSVTDVASVLGLKPPDAVALLERYGYARSPEGIQLRTEQRTAIYDKVRKDRLERRGETPPDSAQAAARDAIASERLEGVDARPWIPS